MHGVETCSSFKKVDKSNEGLSKTMACQGKDKVSQVQGGAWQHVYASRVSQQADTCEPKRKTGRLIEVQTG